METKLNPVKATGDKLNDKISNLIILKKNKHMAIEAIMGNRDFLSGRFI